MGQQKSERELFSYAVNLEKRVRSDHPLRRVAAAIDFRFVREEVAPCYGSKGNVSVDPEVIMKMMFLLFFDDVASERELMKIIAERLDYLWFLGYGLDDEIPDHSVLSKARARWGEEVFEGLFVQTISQCVAAGLVDGRKLHVDSSLLEANASRESVIKGTPELIAALKRAYQATESKLGEGVTTPASYEAVNDRMMSRTDPDAAMVSRGRNDSRPRYHHHRAIDDHKGVITAVETTPGSVTENRKLMDLIEQHERDLGSKAETVVGDHKYGTQDNFVACQERGLTTHMGDASKGQDHHQAKGIFPESAFRYDPATNTYCCPAGELLRPRRVHPIRHTMEYKARAGTCAACPLRPQCTRAKTGRTLHRHEKQAALDLARRQTHSRAARRDRRRRQQLMEASFADAANNHHFKRARWRRLWRQQIQDYLIAAIQNVRILLAHGGVKRRAAANIIMVNFEKTEARSPQKDLLSSGEISSHSAATEAAFPFFLRSKRCSSPDFTFA
ncbi:MAG: IS1182 family transposase [Chthoniobacterales bacterium]|nr:IS1182 family transposase [Chthoniobacterales bacterium]